VSFPARDFNLPRWRNLEGFEIRREFRMDKSGTVGLTSKIGRLAVGSGGRSV